MNAVFSGIAFGIVLAALIGPVFFALLQTSLHKGPKAGILMAIGISASDVFYIVICYLGVSQLFNTQSFKEGLGMIGGIVMLIFGLVTFFKRVHAKPDEDSIVKRGFFRFIFKGFALNAINPFVLIFWIVQVSAASGQYNLPNVILFFSGMILTTFCCDVFKVYLSAKLSKLLTLRFLTWMNRIAGIGLIGFGIKLLYFAMENN